MALKSKKVLVTLLGEALVRIGHYFGDERSLSYSKKFRRNNDVADNYSPRRKEQMEELYGRVVIYMKEEKPYLRDEFTLAMMSQEMYTNKAYLSRTINTMSGHNYRQFINFYRIEYAKEYMRKNPRVLMEKVGRVAGFHSSVSFNMAFKLFEKDTPHEWLRKYRISDKFKQHLSSSKGQELQYGSRFSLQDE